MSLQVIGAGLGRTGTMSLKLALEHLLGGPCYHMVELLNNLEEHLPVWQRVARGEQVDWHSLFDGYVAAVDEPVSSQWLALSEIYPDALVVLSVRDPDSWWQSASETILPVPHNRPEDISPLRRAWLDMILDIYKTQYPDGFSNREAATTALRAHVERVKAGIPAERLLVWEVSQGWEPLCRALALPVPDMPFPKTNSTAEFKARRAKQF